MKIESKEVRGDVSAVFTIENVTIEDTAEIKAVATNKAGEDTCTAQLTVTSKYADFEFNKMCFST